MSSALKAHASLLYYHRVVYQIQFIQSHPSVVGFFVRRIRVPRKGIPQKYTCPLWISRNQISRNQTSTLNALRRYFTIKFLSHLLTFLGLINKRCFCICHWIGFVFLLSANNCIMFPSGVSKKPLFAKTLASLSATKTASNLPIARIK